MTRWGAFAGITLAVLVLLLFLARLSQSTVTGRSAYVAREEIRRLDRLPDGSDHIDAIQSTDDPAPIRTSPAAATLEPGPDLTPTALLANVALSHGLFALLLVGGVWLTDVPVAALGLTAEPLGVELAVSVGLALGLALSLANGLAAALAEGLGAKPSDDLRTLLAPESRRGWAVLLLIVLPVIAGFEELLFRGALVGGFATGFAVSPWLFAALSSVAFAAGHGAQGGPGVVVTGLLGFALAVAFVLTGSLLVVVVAHYVVNATEFVLAEGLGWEPLG